MQSTVLAPFTARDGENLALYEWPLDTWSQEMGDDAPPPRGVVLLVHGLGEHACRYDHVARQLMDWGFAVRAYDQRGHGESGGVRGVLPDASALLDDLAEVVDDTRLRCTRLPDQPGIRSPVQQRLPLILMGHSLGGLVVGSFVAQKLRPVEGLVMCSPALDAGLSRIQKALLALAPRFAHHYPFASGLDSRCISHDAQVVQAYHADRLVHDRMSVGLGRFIAAAGPATIAAAARWQTPTLLMYAGDDRLVDPAGSRRFAQTAAESPHVRASTVTARCFDDLYHELLNEKQPTEVFETLRVWLDARF